jgi:hypothetical protein
MMAVIILFVTLGLGTALVATAVGQKHAGANEQNGEQAYSLAEAALNAQIYELSTQWPTASDAPAGGYPASCNAASNGTSYCPSASDLSAAYSGTSGSCPKGTRGDAWSSSSTVSNGWTTYVRDAGSSTSSTASSFFNSATEETAAADDASGTGAVWVRAVGIVNCKTAVVVSKVSAQIEYLNFPKYVVNANGFETSNNGNKTILDTEDSNGNVSEISLRCTGLGGDPPSASTCDQFGKSAQVSPGPTFASPAASSPTMTSTQLAGIQALAEAKGTYFAAGNCPTSISQLTGNPVYVAGPCNLSFTGSGSANSSTSPGFLVLDDGTLDMNGTTTYYGVIYAANTQGCPNSSSAYCLNNDGDVVETHGNNQVVGGITVDGNGTVNFGSSGAPNLQFDKAAFDDLQAFAGADATPGSFRELPTSQ